MVISESGGATGVDGTTARDGSTGTTTGPKGAGSVCAGPFADGSDCGSGSTTIGGVSSSSFSSASSRSPSNTWAPLSEIVVPSGLATHTVSSDLDVPQTMLSPSSAVVVPQTMLSPSSAVPQTMLSPSSAVPQTMLS